MTEIERERHIEFERELEERRQEQRVKFKNREVWGGDGLLSASILSSHPQRAPVAKGGRGVGGKGEVVKSLSSHPPDLPRQWAEKQLWAAHSPCLKHCPVGLRHTYTKTQAGTLIGCEPVDALLTHAPQGLSSFLYLTDTYIHSSYVTKKKKKNECEWLLAFQVLTLFSRVKVTYQSVGFQRGQFILQTSPQPWLTSVPTNWVTKLMGCLLINKFSTCKHHYVTVLDHLLLKPLIQM